ncbi:MAG: transcriptional repressor [Pseudomonadota bacterium]
MGKRGEMIQAEVLAIMRRHAAPLSAYDLLGELRETNAKTAPPTVYRALAALTERGRVHRLESMNAYIVCQCEDHHQASILSICDDCGHVEESVEPDLFSTLTSIVNKNGFSAQRHVIEVHGVCGACGRDQTTQ